MNRPHFLFRPNMQNEDHRRAWRLLQEVPDCLLYTSSKQREEPYQVLTSSDELRDKFFLRDAKTGGAWLSSARVVRCWVKSRNERNPYH